MNATHKLQAVVPPDVDELVWRAGWTLTCDGPDTSCVLPVAADDCPDRNAAPPSLDEPCRDAHTCGGWCWHGTHYHDGDPDQDGAECLYVHWVDNAGDEIMTHVGDAPLMLTVEVDCNWADPGVVEVTGQRSERHRER